MTTCATCRHWYADDQSQLEHPNEGRGICLLTTAVNHQGRTTYHGDGQKGVAVASAKIGAAFPPQVVITQLETQPGFGCNQHEI